MAENPEFVSGYLRSTFNGPPILFSTDAQRPAIALVNVPDNCPEGLPAGPLFFIHAPDVLDELFSQAKSYSVSVIDANFEQFEAKTITLRSSEALGVRLLNNSVWTTIVSVQDDGKYKGFKAAGCGCTAKTRLRAAILALAVLVLARDPSHKLHTTRPDWAKDILALARRASLVLKQKPTTTGLTLAPCESSTAREREPSPPLTDVELRAHAAQRRGQESAAHWLSDGGDEPPIAIFWKFGGSISKPTLVVACLNRTVWAFHATQPLTRVVFGEPFDMEARHAERDRMPEAYQVRRALNVEGGIDHASIKSGPGIGLQVLGVGPDRICRERACKLGLATLACIQARRSIPDICHDGELPTFAARVIELLQLVHVGVFSQVSDAVVRTEAAIAKRIAEGEQQQRLWGKICVATAAYKAEGRGGLSLEVGQKFRLVHDTAESGRWEAAPMWMGDGRSRSSDCARASPHPVQGVHALYLKGQRLSFVEDAGSGPDCGWFPAELVEIVTN